MRKLHRWVMTVFAILFVYWASSGMTLAIYDLTDVTQGWADGGGPGLRPKLGNDAPALSATDVDKQFATAIQVAQAVMSETDNTNEPLTAVELRMTTTGPQAVVEVGGQQARTLLFDMQTHALLSATPITAMGAMNMPPPGMGAPGNASGAPRNWHVVLKNWHRGNIVGTWGVGVAMVTGIALMLMIVTGVYLYFSLWQRRRSAGRAGFFWS